MNLSSHVLQDHTAQQELLHALSAQLVRSVQAAQMQALLQSRVVTPDSTLKMDGQSASPAHLDMSARAEIKTRSSARDLTILRLEVPHVSVHPMDSTLQMVSLPRLPHLHAKNTPMEVTL